MAKPIDFPESNNVATSKTGLPVGPLPTKDFPGSSTSCWKLSDAELEEVARTGIIWVATSVFSEVQPIIRVTTDRAAALQPIIKA